MAGQSIEFHKIWIEQCEAAEGIRERFGLQDALDYLVGEKLFTFVAAAERDEAFAGELPAFIAGIRRLFSAGEIREYLKCLELTKYLAQQDHEFDEDLDEVDEEPWLENPVLGAEELLRFARVRELLQQ
ncbi:MAG: hypothetical protein IT165_12660 [Bryobacterales bacterium]|nr:hypothetical protein [Bryobacterales bacterium]